MLLKTPTCKNQLPCVEVVHIITDANFTLSHYAWEPEHNIVVLLSSTKYGF
jgi:hypothetical protein